jgi:hypothetical protein
MADVYDVYFGPTTTGPVLISLGQAALSLVIPYTLEYDTEYTWRVDVFDGVYVTTGDEWTFTTAAFAPPAASLHPVSGLITGDNGMVTIRRLVACSDNKVFYET